MYKHDFCYYGIRAFISIMILGTSSLVAAPDLGAPLRQMNTSISALRHASNNHENEIREIQERFLSVEAIVDGLREQFITYSKGQNEQLRSSNGILEVKISEFELVSKGLVIDLQAIKNHVNESTALLTQYKQQLQAFEKHSTVQSQNIENLQATMKTLMDLLQPSDQKELVENVYQVKSGDTLEKIAIAQGTSIKALKELNALTNDRIRINQKLKIPAK